MFASLNMEKRRILELKNTTNLAILNMSEKAFPIACAQLLEHSSCSVNFYISYPCRAQI